MIPRTIIVGYIVPLSILLPIGVFLTKYKKAPQAAKYLFWYLVAALLINFLALVVVKMGKRNLPLLHLYTLVEAVFFLSLFSGYF